MAFPMSFTRNSLACLGLTSFRYGKNLLGRFPFQQILGLSSLHKGVKDNFSIWRLITCLTFVYKVFALFQARTFFPILDSIVLSMQKGFIKSGYIYEYYYHLVGNCDLGIKDEMVFLFSR